MSEETNTTWFLKYIHENFVLAIIQLAVKGQFSWKMLLSGEKMLNVALSYKMSHGKYAVCSFPGNLSKFQF